MKKSLLTLAIFATYFGLQAQITLNQNDVPHSATFDDIRSINTSGIAVPAHGQNVLYNYSTLSNNVKDTIPYMPATRSGFTTSTRFNWGIAYLSNIPLYSEYYTVKNTNGIGRTGSYKLQQHIGIGSISGNSSDTLAFVGNASIFGQIGYNLKFPSTYGTNWSRKLFL